MKTKLSAFAKYAWFILGANMLVILWGVFLRSSKSGDGCGMHWLTCNGEVLPSAPEMKTVIEFVHRIMSAVDGLLMLILAGWAIYNWKRDRSATARSSMRYALISLFFVIVEGALGAGLVLTGNTAETLTPERPVWMAAHLINTFILLAFLVLTARSASGIRLIVLKTEWKYVFGLAIGVLAIFFVGISGSIAALSHMIFPAGTLAEGMAKDFSPTSHILLRLRLLHPVTAILSSVFLIFLTGWLAKDSGGERAVVRWSNVLALLVLGQLAFGTATLLSLGPIVMQLGHLLIADAIWITFVLFAASFLSQPRRDLSGHAG